MKKRLYNKNKILIALLSTFFLFGCSKKVKKKTPAANPVEQAAPKKNKKTKAELALEQSQAAMCEWQSQEENPCDDLEAGAILSAEKTMDQSKEDIVDLLKTLEEQVRKKMPDFEGFKKEPSHGASIYKVLYCTANPCGNLVPVSGGVFLPMKADGQPASTPLPLMSYQHGTQINKADVPSNIGLESLVLAATFSGFGFAAVASDYLGLGDSPGIHPYLHAKTEASTTSDLLKAMRKFSKDNGVQLSNDLYLGGYSQGGHVTMALHRFLEKEDNLGYNIAASAPMAGPYDLSESTTVDAFNNPSESTPYYAVYLVLGMREAYGLFSKVSYAMQTSWAKKLFSWFTKGEISNDEAKEMIPNSIGEIFHEELVTAVGSGSAKEVPLLLALQKNDVYDWAPKAPMRLYHGSADISVPFKNSVKTRQRMHELGATHVQLIDVGPLTHRDAVFPSVISAVTWFHEVKEDREGGM